MKSLYIQGSYIVTRIKVELRSCDQGRRKNGAFILSPTLPMKRKFLSAVIFTLTEYPGTESQETPISTRLELTTQAQWMTDAC